MYTHHPLLFNKHKRVWKFTPGLFEKKKVPSFLKKPINAVRPYTDVNLRFLERS
jgi:hypothetical protein